MENLPKTDAFAVALIVAQVLSACAMHAKPQSPSVQPSRNANLQIEQSGAGRNAYYVLCLEAACPRPSVKHAVPDIGLVRLVRPSDVAMDALSSDAALSLASSQRSLRSSTNTKATPRLRTKRYAQLPVTAQRSNDLPRQCAQRTQDFQRSEGPAAAGSVKPTSPQSESLKMRR